MTGLKDYLFTCRSGNKEIVDLLISQGADDFHYSFQEACASGNMEIINLLISKGVNNWNDGLAYASTKKNIEVLEF